MLSSYPWRMLHCVFRSVVFVGGENIKLFRGGVTIIIYRGLLWGPWSSACAMIQGICLPSEPVCVWDSQGAALKYQRGGRFWGHGSLRSLLRQCRAEIKTATERPERLANTISRTVGSPLALSKSCAAEGFNKLLSSDTFLPSTTSLSQGEEGSYSVDTQ